MQYAMKPGGTPLWQRLLSLVGLAPMRVEVDSARPILRRGRLLVLCSIVALMALLLTPSVARGEIGHGAIPTQLLAAVKSHVENHGYAYAGVCEEIDESKHAGKWCAQLDAVNATDATVFFRPVNPSGGVVAQVIYTAAFVKQGSNWVASQSDLPFNLTPALRDAVKAAAQGRGHGYAGFCDEIDENKHAGRLCAAVEALNLSEATVYYRPVVSDDVVVRLPVYSATFVKQGSAWTWHVRTCR